MRETVINKITEHAKRRKNIFLITGDAGFGLLDQYKSKFPDRFLNLGVAEQNMIGFSAGLSLSGYKVFIYDIIPFLLYRSYEQVRNDICYQRLPITLIGIGSGLTYAPQGVTHYSVEDIAIARTLPNLTILSPSDPFEAQKCIEYAMKSKGPVYIRLAKSREKTIHKNCPKSIEKPLIIKEGKRVAVLFHGSISAEAMEATKNLKCRPLVISLPMIQPLPFHFILNKMKNVHTILTVEEHFIDGGLGSVISDWISREKLSFRLKKLGIKNEFIHAVKNNAGMRLKYGISAENIKREINKAFKYE